MVTLQWCWGEGGRDTWSHCNGVGEKGEGTHGHIAMVLGRRGKGHMVTLQWCWEEGGKVTSDGSTFSMT